jgi:hypothetical protein
MLNYQSVWMVVPQVGKSITWPTRRWTSWLWSVRGDSTQQNPRDFDGTVVAEYNSQ